jgi:hypothetical protein
MEHGNITETFTLTISGCCGDIRQKQRIDSQFEV